MRRAFHLRFVPFGTSFKRLRNARRHTLDVPEGAALCDNEIVVDVGGCSFGYSEPGATDSGKSFIFDHHFTRRDNYPSASAAVLHHACDIVELLDSHDEIWIVTHREPDFDALCAVYLVKSLLGGAPDETDQQQLSKIEPGVLRSYGLGCSGWNDVDGGNGKMLRKINWYNPEICPSAPAGWAVLLAAYASCVDSGKRFHADRCRRLHSVVYAGILRRRSHHEDGMEPLFREARRAIVSKELNPIFDALFDDDSRFSPELELLRNEARAYDRDIASAQLKAYERRLLEGDWQSVSSEVEVQLIAQDSETYVLARSRARAQKESAMRLRVVHGLMRDLIRLRRLLRHGRLKDSDKVLLQLGRLKERYRQAWRFVKISFQDFRLSWRWDRDALRLCASRDGAYLLRTNLEGSDPAKLWSQYIQLTEVEAVFRALKSDLAIRPIWHFTPKRVEAHIMVAFLGYSLWVCLKHKLKASAPSLTPWQLLDQFARIQMVEVWFKLRAGGCICLERITQPEVAQAALIHQLDWPLPQQPPPKIYKTAIENVWTT